jgi:TonB family protein
LYDARYWESAYREMVEAPALILKLQDDLSEARRREAFWISVVVHLVVVLFIVNSQKLAGFMPRQTVVEVSPESNQKDLTYLELPPDEQKVAKRPDTNIISDKDRVATSRTPQLDRQELKKILEASRPGKPGTTGPPTPQQQPAPPDTSTQSPTPQASPPPAPAPPAVAKLQTPTPALSPQQAFGSGVLSPGSAIQQAERATAANRGGYNGGDNGDYGLGRGRKGVRQVGPIETLTDTMGVDFDPYLKRLLHVVRENWINQIPESAVMKRGKVTLEFAILKDGTIAGLKIVDPSGDVPLDRAAYAGILSSFPFQPLPSDFPGPYFALRFSFYYNMEVGEVR